MRTCFLRVFGFLQQCRIKLLCLHHKSFPCGGDLHQCAYIPESSQCQNLFTLGLYGLGLILKRKSFPFRVSWKPHNDQLSATWPFDLSTLCPFTQDPFTISPFAQQSVYLSGSVTSNFLPLHKIGPKPAVLWPLHWYDFLSTSMSYCYCNNNAFSSGIFALLAGSQFEIPLLSITSSIECKTDSNFQLTELSLPKWI